MVRSSSVRVVSRTRSRERDCALGPDRRDAGGPDRVAEVYLASAIGGFPIVHVNDRLAAPEVAHIVRDAGVAAFIHTDGRSAAVSGVDDLSGLQLFSCIGTDRPSGRLVTRSSSALLGHRPPGTESGRDLAIVG